MTDYHLSDRLGVYPAEIHRELNPTWLGAVIALEGVIPPRVQGARYLDIGCGAGMDVIALACANPDMTFVGVDPDPNHILHAEGLARRLSLPNISFISGGFDDPRIGNGYDIVVAHGVYSWLSEADRARFRHCFASAIGAGGIGVLHYLVEPGAHLWRSLRAVLAGLTEHLPVPQALARMAEMARMRWGVFANLPGAKALIDALRAWPVETLRHDLLNSHYAPEAAPVLIADLARLGLGFVASADPLANHDVFALPGGLSPEAPQSRAHRAGLSDIATGRLSRVDIFAPDARLIPADRVALMLDGLSFALMPGRSRVTGFHVPTVFGPISPDADMAHAVLARLGQGPASVRALADLPGITGDLAALFQMLAGMMAVGLVHPLRGIRQDSHHTAAFNALACHDALSGGVPGPISIATGGVIWVGSDAQPVSGARIAALMAADQVGFFE
ncbi:MAG TPA: class I SAM-dependent methyltransferase [Paenirhodobacter sp.]